MIDEQWFKEADQTKLTVGDIVVAGIIVAILALGVYLVGAWVFEAVAALAAAK